MKRNKQKKENWITGLFLKTTKTLEELSPITSFK